MIFGKETYIGDGLYASFDGHMFIIRAPRADGDHIIYIEPMVLNEFNTFVRRTTRELAKAEAIGG